MPCFHRRGRTQKFIALNSCEHTEDTPVCLPPRQRSYLKMATDTVANATNMVRLATRRFPAVAKVGNYFKINDAVKT